MNWLKRFDEGVARGEATLAMLWLLAMIGGGAAQAFCRFCATRLELEWANPALDSLAWVDSLLKLGTMWVALLGASLATRESRHIAIDVLPRLSPPKVRLAMQGVVGVVASVVAAVMSVAFWEQAKKIAAEGEQTFYARGTQLHICEGTASELADAGLEPAPVFCAVRSVFETLGVVLESPRSAFLFIVPVIFVMIAVRLFANGIVAFIAIGKPVSASEQAGEG